MLLWPWDASLYILLFMFYFAPFKCYDNSISHLRALSLLLLIECNAFSHTLNGDLLYNYVNVKVYLSKATKNPLVYLKIMRSRKLPFIPSTMAAN